MLSPLLGPSFYVHCVLIEIRISPRVLNSTTTTAAVGVVNSLLSCHPMLHTNLMENKLGKLNQQFHPTTTTLSYFVLRLVFCTNLLLCAFVIEGLIKP